MMSQDHQLLANEIKLKLRPRLPRKAYMSYRKKKERKLWNKKKNKIDERKKRETE